MPGVIVALGGEIGETVLRGQVLVVVEAMKFENPITAPRDGVVAEVTCAVGDQVKAGQVLVRLEDDANDTAAPDTGK